MRGNAQQVVEKYLNLAREATIAGNRVMAENYLQHAEHYYRIQNANNASSDNADTQGDSQDGNGREQPAYQSEQPAQGANGSAEATAEPVVAPPAVVSEPAAEAAPEPAAEAAPEPANDAALEAAADATPERRTPRRRRPRRSDSGPAKEPTEQPG